MNKIVLWILNLLRSIIDPSTKLGAAIRNYLDEYMAKKAIKNIKNYRLIPQLPNASWTEKFEPPARFYNIIDEKNASIALRSENDFELKQSFAYTILVQSFRETSLLKAISKELFFAGALIRAKMSILEIQDIESECDSSLLSKYLTEQHKLNKKKFDSYLEKLTKLGEYGFFNSVFLYILLVNKEKLSIEKTDNLIDDLIKCEENRLKKKKEFIFGNSKIYFISTDTLIGSFIPDCKSSLDEGKKLLLASVGPRASFNNLKLLAELIKGDKVTNNVLWDKCYVPEFNEWTYAIRVWVQKGDTLTLKQKYKIIDSYKNPKDIGDYNKIAFEIKFENVSLIFNNIIRDRRKIIRKMFVYPIKSKLYIFLILEKKED